MPTPITCPICCYHACTLEEKTIRAAMIFDSKREEERDRKGRTRSVSSIFGFTAKHPLSAVD
jgi:hypothetical protein